MNLNVTYPVSAELGNCLHGKGRTPRYQIDLCFGEEYPDPNIPKNRKLIMAEVSVESSVVNNNQQQYCEDA